MNNYRVCGVTVFVNKLFSPGVHVWESIERSHWRNAVHVFHIR